MNRIIFVAALCTVAAYDVVDAALIARYDLSDHPAGNQNPPPYGLRLDELGSVPGPGVLPAGEYLFSAELAGSNVFLDVFEDDLTGDLSLRIHGTMYGGLQDDALPDHLDTVLRGHATVDFMYRQNVTAGPSGAVYTVTAHEHDLTTGNTGTFEWTDGNGDTHLIHLQDQMASFSARLAYGHRTDPGTLSFWGWVNHSTAPSSGDYPHQYSSDWLFTATQTATPGELSVPEPATMLFLGLGVGAVGVARRRRGTGKATS